MFEFVRRLWARAPQTRGPRLDVSRVPWHAPWEPEDYPEFPEKELRRELWRNHVLYGREAQAVGTRIDNDDWLFYLGETPPRFAVVHLTFSGKPEPFDDCPSTTLYDSLDEWINQGLIPDAQDYDPNAFPSSPRRFDVDSERRDEK